MITNTGKSILAKYLIGQAPAYASYLALGSGPLPLETADPFADYSAKKSLEFEMLRVPIVSKGYANEYDAELEAYVDKIVLTAKLPTENRYAFSEIGIYSAGSNPSAGSSDSKEIFSFKNAENWELHTNDGEAWTVRPPYSGVYGEEGYSIVSITEGSIDGTITYASEDGNPDKEIFRLNSDNEIFDDVRRAEKMEQPRFLDNTIFMRGDSASLTGTSGAWTIGATSHHIHLANLSFDLDKNTSDDELRLAFSVVKKQVSGGAVTHPANTVIRILFQFSSSEYEGTAAEYANMQIELTNADLATNRYFAVSKKLSELEKTSNFTWSGVKITKVFVSETVDGVQASNSFVALDGLRLENISATEANPLFGLTAYTVIKNQVDGDTYSSPITKDRNTNNFIEFRFIVGTQ